MSGAAPLDRAKLARVLALLASDQPGERDAAVLAAGRLLAASGLRWEALAAAGGPPARDIDAEAVAALLKAKAAAAERKADELRASVRRYGAENAALKRRLADVEARLVIETRAARQARDQALNAAFLLENGERAAP